MYRVDLSTGTFKELASPAPWDMTLSLDDKVLYTRANYTTANSCILAFELATKQERQIFCEPAGTNVGELALSPDGRILSFVMR